MHKKLERFGVTLHIDKLKNGANLVLLERKGMPIYLRATFFAGSRFDPMPGTAHLLEHMLLAGTKKFPAKNLIADYIQRVGGDFGASTDSNLLRLNVEIPETIDIDIGMEVLAECLTNPLFDNQTIETERRSVISELRNKRNNPKEYIAEVQRRIALQGTAVATSTLGSEESINNIGRKELINYQKTFITYDRLGLIASGDVSIETLKEKLNSINLESGNKFRLGERLPIIKKESVDVEFYKNVSHLQVALVCRTSIENYVEYCALRVISGVLAVGRGSRLITRLRYESGLIYGISSRVFNTIDWGTLGINFSCDKNKLEEVKNLIFEEFNKLRLGNISLLELENTKLRIAKGAISYFQTSKTWVDFHENDTIFSPSDFHTVEDYIQTVNKLNLDDVKKVIDKYLLQANFYIAICGDYNK